MKTVRIREKIKKFLGDRPRNTAEILEHINSTMRHGTTSQQLGNVLSNVSNVGSQEKDRSRKRDRGPLGPTSASHWWGPSPLFSLIFLFVLISLTCWLILLIIQ